METTGNTGMKYALTASITAVIILLAAVAYLLLRLAHGQITCEFKGSFNDPTAVEQEGEVTPQEGADDGDESSTPPKVVHTRKAPTTPTSGITVPGPATPTVGAPAVTH